MEGPGRFKEELNSQHKEIPGEWITAGTEVVDATEETPISQEFSAIPTSPLLSTASADQYNKELGGKRTSTGAFSLSRRGRLSIEFPPGFGVPVPSDGSSGPCDMSLNLNARNQITNVRLRTNVHTISADQTWCADQALFRRALYVLQRESESGEIGHACMTKPDCATHRSGCGELVKVKLPDGSSVLKPVEQA